GSAYRKRANKGTARTAQSFSYKRNQFYSRWACRENSVSERRTSVIKRVGPVFSNETLATALPNCFPSYVVSSTNRVVVWCYTRKLGASREGNVLYHGACRSATL